MNQSTYPSTMDIDSKRQRARKLLKNMKRNAVRKSRDQVMRDLGLVKVKGALGGTYWE